MHSRLQYYVGYLTVTMAISLSMLWFLPSTLRHYDNTMTGILCWTVRLQKWKGMDYGVNDSDSFSDWLPNRRHRASATLWNISLTETLPTRQSTVFRSPHLTTVLEAKLLNTLCDIFMDMQIFSWYLLLDCYKWSLCPKKSGFRLVYSLIFWSNVHCMQSVCVNGICSALEQLNSTSIYGRRC